MVRWGYRSDGVVRITEGLNEEISLFAYPARPVRASAESDRIEYIRLSCMKTADSSGIQDYHRNGLAICEE
jgi:hypothetical protein